MFTVKIVKLKVRTKIGVSVQERKKYQPLLVSLKFSYKINAFKKYKSEIEKFPHYRSIEALEMLSKKRGIEAGFSKAEAFQLISWYRDD